MDRWRLTETYVCSLREREREMVEACLSVGISSRVGIARGTNMVVMLISLCAMPSYAIPPVSLSPPPVAS